MRLQQPSKYFNVYDKLDSLEIGKYADLQVVEDDITIRIFIFIVIITA